MEDLIDEEIIIQELRDGNSNALAKLYDAYSNRLYSFVFNRVHRDSQVAEDIVQETFLAVIKSLGKFRGKSKFYTWLCSIACHKISDFHRKSQREVNNHFIESERDQIHDMNAPNLADVTESNIFVEQALSGLPLDYQYVLVFKYIEDMSVKEISQIMNRTEKSTEGLLSRARRELKDKLLVEVRENGK